MINFILECTDVRRSSGSERVLLYIDPQLLWYYSRESQQEKLLGAGEKKHQFLFLRTDKALSMTEWSCYILSTLGGMGCKRLGRRIKLLSHHTHGSHPRW